MKTALTAAALALAVTMPAEAQTGSASWYALDGNMTASGERMNSSRMTAAHRKLPFGTKIKVTNLHNNRSVVVRINDRGPFAKGRILDVSKGAARKLGFIGRGHARVRIQRVSRKSALGTQPRWPQLKKLARIALPTKRPATGVASPDDIVMAYADS